MKGFSISTLMLVFIVMMSCGQQSKNDAKTSKNDKATSTISYTGYHTMYEYIDSIGNTLVIKNSFPKGEWYTAPNGKKYVKAIFWTQIENNTNRPLELAINFSGDSITF
ncbi:MAG: hypothetical protein REI78_04645 [Pedobacter sp.]|nr:hypothetical protein [Pedobacter sp.]